MCEHRFMAIDGQPVRWRVDRASDVRVHVCLFANLCLDCGVLVVAPACLKDHRKIARDAK